MKICYIDEAGCCGALPNSQSDVQPVLAICGVAFDYSKLHRTTISLLDLKHRFFPGHMPPDATYLGRILGQVKGSELRKNGSEGGRNIRRQTFGFLDGVLQICDHANVKLIGRVWVKGVGKPFDGRAV